MVCFLLSSKKKQISSVAKPLTEGLATFFIEPQMITMKGKEMEMSFFVRGLLIGLSFAATIGPMSILCIQRTLRNGYFYGLVSGLGVATADATYSSIAGFGLTVISNFLLSKQGTD